MKKPIKGFAILFCFFALIGFSLAYAADPPPPGGPPPGHLGGGGAQHNRGGGPGVPEIDPGMAAGAIAFLSCGAAILGSRKKK